MTEHSLNHCLKIGVHFSPPPFRKRIIAAKANRLKPVVLTLWWKINDAFFAEDSATLAISSADDGSIQCKCPTRDTINLAHRPEPQPMSKPVASAGKRSHGKTAKYSSNILFASSSDSAD